MFGAERQYAQLLPIYCWSGLVAVGISVDVYAMVGKPYISMNWSGNVYNSMLWSELVLIRGINVRRMPVR